jgi:hypothetical protein
MRDYITKLKLLFIIYNTYRSWQPEPRDITLTKKCYSWITLHLNKFSLEKLDPLIEALFNKWKLYYLFSLLIGYWMNNRSCLFTYLSKYHSNLMRMHEFIIKNYFLLYITLIEACNLSQETLPKISQVKSLQLFPKIAILE